MKFKDRLKLAGKEFGRANFGNVIKSFSAPSTYPLQSDGYRGGAMFFVGTDGKEIHFSYSGLNSAVLAYASCPPVSAIVNKKAQAYINGRTLITNTTGKAKGKEATGDIANKLRKLMTRPNPLQSWKQFEAQAYIYQQLFGFNVLLVNKPVGFSNIDASNLWNLPPYMLSIYEKPGYNFTTVTSIAECIQSIQFIYRGASTDLDLESLYIMKDFTPSMQTMLLPESRLLALQMPINNIIGAYESRNVLINRRGPQSIISSEKSDDSGNIALTPTEKEDIEADFSKRYGLRSDQVQHIITAANIKIQTVGFSTKELMLFEEIDDDIMRIADGYTFPYQLLASAKGTTFENMNTARKLLYQDAIIPESESNYEQWNQFFGLQAYNLEVCKDYRHIAAMQEDDKAQAEARRARNQAALIEFQNNVIKLNEWRALNGDTPIDNAIGDMYYYELVNAGITFGAGPTGSSVPEDQSSRNAAATPNTTNNG